jgi:hypothetical protein
MSAIAGFTSSFYPTELPIDGTLVSDALTMIAPPPAGLHNAARRAKERRRWPRHATFAAAKIVVGGYVVSECLVRDASATGARLQVGCSVGIPDAFDLFLSDGQTRARCRVVWQNGRAMGVRFVA